MRTIIQKTLLFAAFVALTSGYIWAQRVITGTVYMKGKPAAGIIVEAQRGGQMMTSFDGKYKVEASDKTKWLSFTYIDDTKKLEIEGKSGDVFDFYFDDIKPETSSNSGNQVNLESQEQLVKDNNDDYLNAYSMYDEFYKQNNFSSALPHWRKVYNKYPKSHPNLYIRGAKMYDYLIEHAKTDEEKDKDIDILMKIYDNRIKYFDDEGYVLGRKAVDFLQYKLDTSRTTPLEGDKLKEVYQKGYEWLNKSVDDQGNKSEPPVLLLLMQTSRQLFKLGVIPKETVVTNYDKCMSIIKAVVAENSDAERVKGMNEILPFVDKIFEESGAADCEALVNIYTPQFKEKRDDVEFIKNMLLKLDRANCEESQLYDEASQRLYELEPSAQAAYNMARRLIIKGDIAQAKKFYKEAIDQETDKELLSTYYLQYAKVLYSEKSFQDARDNARKALEANPDNCDADMLIGDIYVQASKTYGKDAFEKSTVFWVAVDYYQKARRNENCAIDAAEKVKEFSKYFPSKEDAFMESLETGQTYKVGGWINETTKVRF